MAAVTTQLNNFIMPADQPARVSGPGLMARLSGFLEEARGRRIERDVASLIERNGGALNDGVEREIARRLV